MSDDEIEKMVKDAEANADADKKKLEAIETRNNADSIIHSTEKSLKEHGSKVPKEDKEKIEKSLESLKETFKDEKADIKILKEKTDTLIQDSMKLGEIMYKEAQEKAAKEESKKKDSDPKNKEKKTKSKKNPDVMDADFEDVTDKKDKPKDDDKKEKSA